MSVPGGTKSSYAGKKRREASIDRLRDRSPSERWKLLQRMWQPFSDGDQSDTPAAPAESPEVIGPAAGRAAEGTICEASATSVTAAASEIPEVGAEQQAADSDTVEPELPTLTWDLDAPTLPAPTALPDTPAANELPGQTDSPLWVIDAGAPEAATGVKRSGPETVMTSLQAEDPATSADEELQQQIAEASALKPITDILPYYDYVPEGTTEPEDILCLDGGDDMNCPKLVELPEIGFEGRYFPETYVAWEPSNLFSNPLYFEDASLERYGHTHGCLQPLFSLGKFSAQLVGLPYQMALHPVCEHRYALGWYRPGECAPKKYYLPPWNTKAAITAGATYTGLIFLIP